MMFEFAFTPLSKLQNIVQHIIALAKRCEDVQHVTHTVFAYDVWPKVQKELWSNSLPLVFSDTVVGSEACTVVVDSERAGMV